MRNILRIWIVVTLIIGFVYVILNPAQAFDYLGSFIAFFLISKILFMYAPKVKKTMLLYTLPVSFIAVSFFLKTHVYPELMFLTINRLLLLVFILADKYINIRLNKKVNVFIFNIIAIFTGLELMLVLIASATGMDILKRQNDLFRLQPNSQFNNSAVNAEGYPGIAPHTEKKTERWVFIGDSFGVGVVDYRFNFIQMCSDSLGLETVNLSQPGFSTLDYYAQLEKYIDIAQGDRYIIVIFTGNDISERPINENNWAFENLRTVCLFKNAIALMASKNVSDDYTSFDMGDSLYVQIEARRAQINDEKMYGSEWGSFANDLIRIKELCSERKKALTVLTIPDEFTINTELQNEIHDRTGIKYDFLYAHQRVLEILDSLSIRYLDTYNALDTLYKSGVNPYRKNNSHINEIGNRVVFEKLREFYIENSQF